MNYLRLIYEHLTPRNESCNRYKYLIGKYFRTLALPFDFQIIPRKKYNLCVTTEILNEYAEIFATKANVELSDYALKTIENAPNVNFITRYYAFELIKVDPDDNKFVDCSIAANADFIVTQDVHFQVLKNVDFPKITVISINDFMSILKEQSSDSILR